MAPAAVHIALHEVRRLAAPFRKPAHLAAVVVAIALLALLAPRLAERGLHPDRDLYAVRLDEASPIADAVREDVRFHLVDAPLHDGADLEVGATRCRDPCSMHWWGAYDPSDDASVAAARELEDAVRRWQEGRFEDEEDEAAAFPVAVNLVLAAPDPSAIPARTTPPTQPEPGAPPAPDGSVLQGTAEQAAIVQREIRPAAVEPPFPVRSLLLTFAFLIPMNFVAQLHAGSLLADRSRRRALLALTSPHPPRTILLGRSLPYLAAGLAVWVGAAILTGAGWQGWLATLPIILAVLASSLLLGLLARSERELTFLLTGTTTMLAVFLFLPAIFTALPPVAFLSPVSVLVASMEGEAVSLGLFLYATVPLSLCTLALGLLGSALYREETLFSPRRLRDKTVSALAVRSRTTGHALVAGALAVPFAFVLELLVLSLAIPMGARAVLPVTLVGVAFVEERLKLAVAAARRRRGANAAWAGVWAGAGFFLGEKLALLLAIVGFGDLILGPETLRVFGVAGGWLLLAAPLVLHATCSAIAATGLGRSRPVAALFYLAAVAIHLAYNLAVVFLGGGT